MKYLFYDIESCSGNYQDGSLCSFGYCLTDENFNVLKKEDILVNPAPKTFALLYGKKPRIHLAYEESEFRKAGKFPAHYEVGAGKTIKRRQSYLYCSYLIYFFLSPKESCLSK